MLLCFSDILLFQVHLSFEQYSNKASFVIEASIFQ